MNAEFANIIMSPGWFHDRHFLESRRTEDDLILRPIQMTIITKHYLQRIENVLLPFRYPKKVPMDSGAIVKVNTDNNIDVPSVSVLVSISVSICHEFTPHEFVGLSNLTYRCCAKMAS